MQILISCSKDNNDVNQIFLIGDYDRTDVEYHFLESDTIVVEYSKVIDIDQDSILDLNLYISSTIIEYEWESLAYGHSYINSLHDNILLAIDENDSRLLKLLNPMDTLNSVNKWKDIGNLFEYDFEGTDHYYSWINKSGYVGFKFKYNSYFYYGWMKIRLIGNDQIIIYEYAYQKTS